MGLGFQPDFIPENLIITSAFMLILTFLSWCNGTLIENFRLIFGVCQNPLIISVVEEKTENRALF